MPDTGRRSAARWNDLGVRAVSAIVLAPLVLFCVWRGELPFTILMMVGALGLAGEWGGLCRVSATRWPGVLLPMLLLVGGGLAAEGFALAGLIVVLAGTGLIRWLSGRVLLASGLLYIGLALVAILWLRRWNDPDGRTAVFFVILVVWGSDIGAYVAGRLLRGPKLAPSLSPAKTWSGALGGLVVAMIVGEIVAGRASFATAAVAALLAVVCQAGDLLESGIKRHVGVKDTGRLIPGHGGLLDRLDGLLAAAPVAAAVAMMSREGIFW